ncbi:MAG: hypothetical protein HKO93_04360, partial [Flavobacteriales bacterium]|nr:hypothetical protein [Flavobacteriales bacterium]
IDGTGTIDLYRVDVNGDITTESDIVIKNDLNVAVSGSFSASAGIVSFDGTSNLSGTADLFRSTINSGNSLTLGSNSELRVKNSLTINGTLDCSSHTPNSINYCGSGSQTVVDNTYYNLYLSTGGVKTAASDFTVLGDLVIASGATFAGSSREIQIYKDWTNNGSFAAGTSDIQFVSNNISNLTGTTTFNDFTVNKSSDEIEVFLKSDMTASNIIMTTGLLDTESNSITTTSGRSGNGIIHGTVVHQHSFTNGTPYYFEGPNNSLTFTSPSGITSVSVDCRPQEITDFINDKEAVYREYDISINGGSYTDATWRLHYEDNELNAFEEPFLTFYRHDTGTLWDSLGFTSRDQVNNWVELVGETDAEGRFALSGTRREVEWNGSVSSDWHDASNWTTISGTDMSNRVPTSEDAVEIGISNFTNQPSLTTKESIASLTLGSAKAVTITLSDTLHVVGNVRGTWSSDRSHTIDVGSSVLEIDQSFTMSDGTNGRDISLSIGSGEVHIANDLIQTGAADITFTGAGNLKVNGDYSFISGNFTAGSGTMTYSGSKRQDVAALTYNNLSLTKSNETAQVNLPTVVNGNLILTSGGRLLCNDSLTVTGDINIGAGTTILEDNSHIILSGDWINDGVFSPSTGSVRFTGTSNQSVDSTLFSNMIIDKAAGSVSLSNHIFLEGDLSLLNGTFDLSTYQANRTNSGGTLTLGSGTTIKLGGADNFPKVFVNNTIDANATVEYNGTMAQTVLPGIDYGHLSFDNGSSNAKQVLEDVTVSGDLTISDDATLYLDAVELVLEGNLDNQGTIDPTQSLLTLNGSSKTITGPVTLHSLDVNGSYTVATGTTTM